MIPYCEIIEKVRTHLLRQGKKCNTVVVAPDGTLVTKCAYLNEDGMRCAIGVLLTDNALSFLKERAALSEGVWTASVRKALAMSGYMVTKKDYWFFRSLQHVHDDCDPVTWSPGLDQYKSQFIGAVRYVPPDATPPG